MIVLLLSVKSFEKIYEIEKLIGKFEIKLIRIES